MNGLLLYWWIENLSIQPSIHPLHIKLNVIHPLIFLSINPSIHPLLKGVWILSQQSLIEGCGRTHHLDASLSHGHMERQTLAVTPTHTLQFPVCHTCTCLNTPAVSQLGSLFLFNWVFHTDTGEPLRLSGFSVSAAACTVFPADLRRNSTPAAGSPFCLHGQR